MQVDPVLTAWFSLLKLKCDNTLSNVAFNGFNLRPCSMAEYVGGRVPRPSYTPPHLLRHSEGVRKM